MVLSPKREVRLFQAFCAVANKAKYHSEVNINSIAEEYGVTKQALYKQGYSVDLIIERLRSYVDHDVRELFTERFLTIEAKDFINFLANEVVPLMYEKREFYRALFGKTADPGWANYCEEGYKRFLLPYFKNHPMVHNADEAEFITRLAIRQILVLFSRWLVQENPQKPEQFKEIFLYFTNRSVQDLFAETN